jgi:hypothetical protein
VIVDYEPSLPLENLLRLNPALQDGAGNDVVAIDNYTVTNNSTQLPDTFGPQPTSLSYVNQTVTVVFNEAINGQTAPVSSYLVYVGMSLVEVLSVDVIDGNKVALTLAEPVTAGQIVNVYYAPSGEDPTLEDLLGNDAGSFTISSNPKNTEWSWTDLNRTASTSCATFSGQKSTIASNTSRQRTLPNGITYSIGVEGPNVCIGASNESLAGRGGIDSMFASIGMVTEPGTYLEQVQPTSTECGVKTASSTEYCERPNDFVYIRFDRPVTNPTFSFSGWGAFSGSTQSWSELLLVTPNITLTQISPGSNIVLDSGTWLRPGTTTLTAVMLEVTMLGRTSTAL